MVKAFWSAAASSDRQLVVASDASAPPERIAGKKLGEQSFQLALP
jgi:hypothetical protein